MSGITLSDLNEILEKVIRPAVEDQLYYKTILWNMVGGYNSELGTGEKKNMGVLKTSMDNQTFYIPILTAHSSGAVAIAEGGSLIAGKPTLDQAAIPARYETGTFQIDKQTLAVKDAGVAVRQLDFYVRQNTLAMAIDLNRQCYTPNQVGTANATQGGGGSTTFVFAPSVNGDIDYTRYTPPGTSLIIGANAAVAVLAILAKNTVQLAVAKTWSIGDVVQKADGAGAAAVELDGLATAVSTSATYQGIAPGSDPAWVAGYVDNPVGAVTLKLADMNTAFVQGNRTGEIKYILMNATEFAAYGGLLTPNIRYDYHEVLGGGWRGLDFMGGQAQVVLDYDCPDDRLYFLSPDAFTLGEMSPFEWEKGTDGILLRIQGTLNYEAVGTWFGNLGCFKRSANAFLGNRKN
jgi:hypothetical protein